jgi:hypothetical protein
MNTWHVKVTMEFDVEGDESELSYLIREEAQNRAEELDIWDDEEVSFDKTGECDDL